MALDTINSGRTMFSTVLSCFYEKQLCRGGGEPALLFRFVGSLTLRTCVIATRKHVKHICGSTE